MTADETLREFLDRRERELTNRLVVSESVTSSIKVELAEVRHAKDALDGPYGILEALEMGTSHGLVPPSQAASLAALSAIASSSTSPYSTSASELSPYHRVSIRQLILMALDQNSNFRNTGASANALREFIRDAYGRDIERTSFSPQLSRLRDEGFIDSRDGNWFRIPTAVSDKTLLALNASRPRRD
jgi:hypothetical protein